MTDLHIEFNPQLDPAKSLPYTCYRCGKVWKAKPGMANVGCAVNHAPGTCCHYNETEVTGQAATGPQQGDGLKRLPQSDQVDTLDDPQGALASTVTPTALDKQVVTSSVGSTLSIESLQAFVDSVPKGVIIAIDGRRKEPMLMYRADRIKVLQQGVQGSHDG